MMWDICKEIILGAASLCYGVLSAAGVFTVLIVIGLIPRFAGRTNTAAHVMRYEDMVVAGTISGGVFTIFDGYFNIGAWWQNLCERLSGTALPENLLGGKSLIEGDIFSGGERLQGLVGQSGSHLGDMNWGWTLLLSGNLLGELLLVGGAFFCGMFIGCLALAIAEMLDGVPIFSRRVCFEKGISLAIFWIAIGKICGSILYFVWGIEGV